jgi:hypothetical protein
MKMASEMKKLKAKSVLGIAVVEKRKTQRWKGMMKEVSFKLL